MAELIREVIIVEGRDDIDAVQKAVSADILFADFWSDHGSAAGSSRDFWRDRCMACSARGGTGDDGGGTDADLQEQREKPCFIITDIVVSYIKYYSDCHRVVNA